jgi:cytochrome c nitrite reductase small subunit
MGALKAISPPGPWKTPVAILLGVLVGLIIYTFYVSNAASYLSNDPKTCINCHVMNPQYATWFHSSHRENASCNDCHVPHNNALNKYYFKAKDGMRHAAMFTFRKEPQVIMIKEEGKAVVQENCKRCHENVNENVGTLDATLQSAACGEGKLCWECHREVPHGRVNSISAAPHAQIPVNESIVPDWLKELMNE